MDRNHYRMCSDSYLIETALYAPDAELAIVLGERLEEVQGEFDEHLAEVTNHAKDLEDEVDKFEDEMYLLQSEIARNEITITSMAAEIEYLKEQAA